MGSGVVVGDEVSPMSEASAHEHTPEPKHGHLRSLVGPVRAVGFWSAVTLPFLYPVFLLNGQDAAMAGLLVLHVLALVVGHAHNR
jgi:hypothetical protein